jgi:hypothetical protein
MPTSDTWFKPGNPGRPKGARSRLSEAFLTAIADDFDEHGIATLVSMREQRPGDYIKVIASLMPRDARFQLEAKHESLAEILARTSQLECADEPVLLEADRSSSRSPQFAPGVLDRSSEGTR